MEHLEGFPFIKLYVNKNCNFLLARQNTRHENELFGGGGNFVPVCKEDKRIALRRSGRGAMKDVPRE